MTTELHIGSRTQTKCGKKQTENDELNISGSRQLAFDKEYAKNTRKANSAHICPDCLRQVS